MNTQKEKNFKRLMRKKRSRAKVFGTKNKPRLTVFRSNQMIYVQLIDDEAGHTLAAAASKNPAEAGNLLATKAKKIGIAQAVFQKGPYKYHGQVKILAEEVKKSGINI